MTACAPEALSFERVPTVDLYTIRELLRMKSALEIGMRSEDDSEFYWFGLLRGRGEADVFEAAWEHYRSEARPLWPADILERVDRMASMRAEGARAVRAEIVEGLAVGRQRERWIAVFDEEVARGAGIDDAMRAADACRSPGSSPRNAFGVDIIKLQ